MANTLKFGNGNWATKDGSTLAYNDESGFNPLPFDFTRASSATVVNKNGLIETVASGIPRIDFQGNTKGALLLEPQRTNSLLQSNQFDTSWSLSGTTITSGQSGVGGSNNAWLLEKNATNGRVIQNITSSGIQTFSVYAKSGTNNWVSLLVNGGGNPTAYFDLQNGVLGGSSGGVTNRSIESVGNGWYRISITFNESVTRVRIYVADSDGNSGGISGNILIQNAQLEAGSYATSIINTSGSAVTREADVCNNGANSEVINSTEGVLYVEASKLVNGGQRQQLTISDGTNDNIVIIQWNSTPNRFQLYVRSGAGAYDLLVVNNIPQTDMNKIALSWDSVNYYAWINGVKLGTKVLTSQPVGLNNISFDQSGSSNFFGKTKDVRVFTTALTDAELIALTSI